MQTHFFHYALICGCLRCNFLPLAPISIILNPFPQAISLPRCMFPQCETLSPSSFPPLALVSTMLNAFSKQLPSPGTYFHNAQPLFQPVFFLYTCLRNVKPFDFKEPLRNISKRTGWELDALGKATWHEINFMLS